MTKQQVNILFVTSSTKLMYDTCGKQLIESFIKYSNNEINAKLLYCTELFDIDILNDNITSCEISNYQFLTDWLNKFNMYIPPKFGGSYDIKKTPSVRIPKDSARYKASLWFRKIASLHYAYTNYKFNKLIWVDNDCSFLSEITNDIINKLFNNNNIFICYGDYRIKSVVGVETGFFGLQNDFTILTDLFETYTNGEFMKTVNWGDGHVLAYIIEKNKNKYLINDLGKGINEQHIMNYIPLLKNFIIHKKGFYKKNNIDYVRD